MKKLLKEIRENLEEVNEEDIKLSTDFVEVCRVFLF
jgi:hypothetical protein